MTNVQTDINKRWEEGIPHHPRSIALFEAIKKIDFELCNDYFGWKSGGDGDNGETFMFELDIYFERLDQEQDAELRNAAGDIADGFELSGAQILMIYEEMKKHDKVVRQAERNGMSPERAADLTQQCEVEYDWQREPKYWARLWKESGFHYGDGHTPLEAVINAHKAAGNTV